MVISMVVCMFTRGFLAIFMGFHQEIIGKSDDQNPREAVQEVIDLEDFDAWEVQRNVRYVAWGYPTSWMLREDP